MKSVGSVSLDMLIPDRSSRRCSLLKVAILYVPKLAYNLVSVARATEAGKSVTFSKTGCPITVERPQHLPPSREVSTI